MEDTNTQDGQGFNHWKAARAVHYDDVRAAAKTGRSISEIARVVGISKSVAASCLKDLGIPAPEKGARAAGDAIIAMHRDRRAQHLEQVADMFGQGYPVLRIANAIGISRATVNKCLDDLGLERPDISEGNRRGNLHTSPSARKQRAAAAHEAVRRRGENPHTRKLHSERDEASLRYIGEGEEALMERLQAAGFDCVPQAARNGYNIDILVGNVAVEVHNASSRPHHTAQRLCRIVELIGAGIHSLYVKTGPDCPVISETAMEKIIAFLDFARSNPSAPREYRVIRGDGKIDHTAKRQFDHVTSVIVAHCRPQSDP